MVLAGYVSVAIEEMYAYYVVKKGERRGL
ncbi:MAG: hypothetical protein H6Q71_2045, partial [Firmicutes bacterium]|nr:hypothetical protein [Bacillota bacterium]